MNIPAGPVVCCWGWDWGIEGVAIATFLAEWTGARLGCWSAAAAFADLRGETGCRFFDRPPLDHQH